MCTFSHRTMTENWYYQVMGEHRGPVDFAELIRLVRSNDIERDTFVRQGEHEWLLAEAVSGLFPPFCPSTPAEPRWYFRIMGEIRGPVAQTGLRRFAEQNDIDRNTFVRRDNGDWVTADRVAGLLR